MPSPRIGRDGKPLDKAYLECGLPEDLSLAIQKVREASTKSLRGLWQEELYGDINASLHAGEISDECARYLRKKYLQIGPGVEADMPAMRG